MDNTVRTKTKQKDKMDLRFSRSLRVEKVRLTFKNSGKTKADKV